MSLYNFSDPRTGFSAVIAANSEPRAQMRAALLNISLLANRSGDTHPARVCPRHGPLREGAPYFDHEFFDPMEVQLTALFKRCAKAEVGGASEQ